MSERPGVREIIRPGLKVTMEQDLAQLAPEVIDLLEEFYGKDLVTLENPGLMFPFTGCSPEEIPDRVIELETRLKTVACELVRITRLNKEAWTSVYEIVI